MDSERSNLVALVHETAEHGPQAAAWRLAGNLRGYFYLRRYASDQLVMATDALRAAKGHPGPQAAAHLNLAAAHSAQGDNEPALAHNTAALALAEQAGWLQGQAAALNNLGTVYSYTGRAGSWASWGRLPRCTAGRSPCTDRPASHSVTRPR